MAAAKKYRVLVGINYPSPSGRGEKRAEPGDLVDDLSEKVTAAWLKQGIIEPASIPKKDSKLNETDDDEGEG